MQLPEASWLLGFVVACAVIGFLIGHLIRERPTVVERKRPRIAVSTVYLRDAHNRTLSTHSRTKCAFDCIYFCCTELSVSEGCRIDEMLHPTREVVRIGLSAISATDEQLRTAELLTEWVASVSPQLSSVSIAMACKLASFVRERAIAVLS